MTTLAPLNMGFMANLSCDNQQGDKLRFGKACK